MNAQKRKISLDRYMDYPSQVISFVNRKAVEVVVYDGSGPVAKIAPYRKMVTISNLREKAANDESIITAQEMRDIKEVTPEHMNEGGVWKLSDETRREMEKTGWLKKLSQMSPSELLRKARIPGFLHSHARA